MKLIITDNARGFAINTEREEGDGAVTLTQAVGMIESARLRLRIQVLQQGKGTAEAADIVEGAKPARRRSKKAP